MTEPSTPTPVRRRRKLRSHRQLNTFLLTIGLTGFVLGLGLYGYAHQANNTQLKPISGLYLIAACVALGVRIILRLTYRYRSKKRSQAPIPLS